MVLPGGPRTLQGGNQVGVEEGGILYQHQNRTSKTTGAVGGRVDRTRAQLQATYRTLHHVKSGLYSRHHRNTLLAQLDAENTRARGLVPVRLCSRHTLLQGRARDHLAPSQHALAAQRRYSARGIENVAERGTHRFPAGRVRRLESEEITATATGREIVIAIDGRRLGL